MPPGEESIALKSSTQRAEQARLCWLFRYCSDDTKYGSNLACTINHV